MCFSDGSRILKRWKCVVLWQPLPLLTRLEGDRWACDTEYRLVAFATMLLFYLYLCLGALPACMSAYNMLGSQREHWIPWIGVGGGCESPCRWIMGRTISPLFLKPYFEIIIHLYFSLPFPPIKPSSVLFPALLIHNFPFHCYCMHITYYIYS